MIDHGARSQQLAEALASSAQVDPAHAAILAYELGEIHERWLDDEPRALEAYRRAIDLDATLQPAAWALRRLLSRTRDWTHLAKLVDIELARAASDGERAELLFERALVCTHGGLEKEARSALVAALRIAPHHQGALLELERIVAQARELPAILDTWEQLAGAIDHPGRKIAYWLDVAKHAAGPNGDRARKALDAAARVASGCPPDTRWQLTELVARARLRVADASGADQQVAAIETLADVLSAARTSAESPMHAIARERELIALWRRRAQLARAESPATCWEYLERAAALAPQEPLLLVDMLELATEAGLDQAQELAHRWQAVEDDAGRAAMLSVWSGEAHLDGERTHRRTLLRSLGPIGSGFVLLASIAECDALSDPSRLRNKLDLANAYLSMAHASVDGTWLGSGAGRKPDARAATALYVQAAHLLAYHIATPAAIEQAQEALAAARAVAPSDPMVREASTELDDACGRTEDALSRLRDGPNDRPKIERAIRLVYRFGQPNAAAVELVRELIQLEPSDLAHAWCLDAMLAEAGRDAERVDVLGRLARGETDPGHRATALLALGWLHERTGAEPAAIDAYRELRVLTPDRVYARDALVDLLRSQRRWAELADERCAEARESTDPAAIRRSLREAAWVVEVGLEDAARAAEIYAEWLGRVAGDRTALEGLARCRAAIGDFAGEVEPRATIAGLDNTAETSWLYARSLEHAARYEDAAQQYRHLAARDDVEVVAVTAILALGDLAARGTDIAARAEAAEALARRTSDARLAAGSFESVGWMCLVALADFERAGQVFAAALAQNPGQPGALLGAALVAARHAEAGELAAAQVGLAANAGTPKLAAAAWMRAAAIAAARHEVEVADEHVARAWLAAPDDVTALVVAAGTHAPKPTKTRDPFAATEQLVARAKLLEQRAALVDDPVSRRSWELDRAEALELGGQIHDAAAAVTTVLSPDDWRALVAWRRIAESAGDTLNFARASDALARLSRDRDFKLRLLRDALRVYDSDPTSADDWKLAVCRQIAAIDHEAPEVERMFAVLRGGGKTRELVDALSDELTRMAAATPRDEAQMVVLLLERAGALSQLGHADLTTADLDAILEHAPHHAEALHRRADIAIRAGDLELAATLCSRYLDRPRADIERMLARGFDEESTVEQSLGGDTTLVESNPSPKPAGVDPFTSTTIRRDLSALLARESAARDDAATTVETAVIADTPPLRVPALELGPVAPLHVFEQSLEGATIAFPHERDLSEDDSDRVMMSFDQLQSDRSEDRTAEMLPQYEREIAVDPATATNALRIEAGRLNEKVGRIDAARAHYEAAIVAGPRAAPALRALRRIARDGGDLAEAASLLEREIEAASPRERYALQRYRLDLLMAAGEYDVARVAVGELLDRAPDDVPALLVQLELALLDNRTDDLRCALDGLAESLPEPSWSAAVRSARGILAMHDGDPAAATWSVSAAAANPESLALQLEALRTTAHGESAGAALQDFACHVEGEDPITAAALALRVVQWGASAETMTAAVQLAAQVAPRDPLVARVATETALALADRTIATRACSRWVHCKCSSVERAYAAARAAELDPERLDRLWAQVIELDPDDDYATARLRASLVAAGERQRAARLDLERAAQTKRDRPLVRAASELVADGSTDEAVDVLTRARAERPTSLEVGEALAAAFAASGRWLDRARLLTELANAPAIARDVARLRNAFGWEKATRAAVDTGAPATERTIVAALDAWDMALEDDAHNAIGHAASIALSRQLPDHAILIHVLARAEAAQRSPWAASSLAVRRAQRLLLIDPRQAQEVASSAAGIDDPRRTILVMMAAAQRRELGEVASALEDRAGRVESALERGTLRLRAAQLALDAGDPKRALALLPQVERDLPGLVDDLIDVALQRTGSVNPIPRPKASSFSRAMHDADRAAARGDRAGAVELYQSALQIRSTEPLAAVPMVRIAFELRDPAPISALALEQARTAETMDDPISKAAAYELLARVEKELRNNTNAALTAVANAIAADPTRADLEHWLEWELTTMRRSGEVLALREQQLARFERPSMSNNARRDVIALSVDAAALAVRNERPDAMIAKFYRTVLELDPSHRLALAQLEAILRRTGLSLDLATLQERIADTLDDPRSKAAFLTRAGETLAGVGKAAEAVQRFRRAADILPTYQTALDNWHQTALAGELWLDLAEAVTRKVALSRDPKQVAALHHFAGIVLMDKAHAIEPAIVAFRRALDADPTSDAFERLRMLFENEGRQSELTGLLRERLNAERDPAANQELRYALAEHLRSVGDSAGAVTAYRDVLRTDPAAVRAHAAIADIASEHGTWQTAADAVLARVPLEHDPKTLRTLHYRLGVLYADHDQARATRELQQALHHNPKDLDALRLLADLAITTKDWQVALDACNTLVTTERDPDRLASHFHRAAKAFEGLGDRERAGRMLQLAAEAAPSNPNCLRLLVEFHDRDPKALVPHLARVVDAMRTRVAKDVRDGAACHMLVHALAVQDTPSLAARVAAELAQLLGTGCELEQRMLAEPARTDVQAQIGLEADERLFAGSTQPDLRKVFSLLGRPIAKHVGVDLGAHVRRKDRLQQGDPVLDVVLEIASLFGHREIDVYIADNPPFLMLAEPTQPISLVLGAAIAGDKASTRFAAGAALKLAQLWLSIPARLPVGELGVLALAVLRLLDRDVGGTGLDLDEVDAQVAKLRRIIPATELDLARRHAGVITTFDHHTFARDLKLAGLRAGLAASGSLLPGITILAGSLNTDVTGALAAPVVADLISFALASRVDS